MICSKWTPIMNINEKIKEARCLFNLDQFLTQAYDEAIKAFNGTPSPLGLINFACNVRELLRNLMDEYAPDTEIEKCSWFSESQYSYAPKDSKKIKPTRRAKIRFYLTENMCSNDVALIYQNIITEYEESYVGFINKLSAYTHFDKNSYFALQQKIKSSFEECLDTLCEINCFLKTSKERTYKRIEQFLYSDIFEEMNTNMPSELDILSPHTSIEGINVYYSIDSIQNGFILISGEAQLDVNLRYGSNSDFRNDDGFECSKGFKVHFRTLVNVTNFADKRYEYDPIDNSTFFE